MAGPVEGHDASSARHRGAGRRARGVPVVPTAHVRPSADPGARGAGLLRPVALADTEPPVIDVSSPQDYPRNIFERGEDASPSFGCQDVGADPSGIASCAAGGDLTSEGALDTATLGDKSFGSPRSTTPATAPRAPCRKWWSEVELGGGSGVSTDQDEDDGATPGDPFEMIAARGNGITGDLEDARAPLPARAGPRALAGVRGRSAGHRPRPPRRRPAVRRPRSPAARPSSRCGCSTTASRCPTA